jgi:hypothetical protein
VTMPSERNTKATKGYSHEVRQNLQVSDEIPSRA